MHQTTGTRCILKQMEASDDGWGAVLFQVIKGTRRVICMWGKQWPGTFDTKPPYHKEAKAWMNAMELIQPFASGSPFPVQVFTDHSPLTWIKHTSGKGPVSQFLVTRYPLIRTQHGSNSTDSGRRGR